MSETTPGPRSAFRTMLLAVLLAWSACGVYRWRVPPLVEVRATVQVPAATDLGTLCQRPEVRESAIQQFAKTAEGLVHEHPVLGGRVLARKLQNSIPQIAASSGERHAHAQTSVEAWEISYRSHQAADARDELTAILTILQQRVHAVHEAGGSGPDPAEVAAKVETLEEQLLNNELSLDLLNDQQGEVPDPAPLATQQQRVSDLRQRLAAAEKEGDALREQGRLAEDEFAATRQLATASRILTAGPIQVAVRNLETKFQLSSELTRLNESEQRLSNVYGEKHPKLAEIHARFDQILEELGGWEEVLAEAHVGEQLHETVEAVLSEQLTRELTLSQRLDSELDVLKSLQANTQQIAERSAEQASLSKELAALRNSTAANENGTEVFTILKPPAFAELPWYLQSLVLYVLATFCGVAAGLWIHRGRVARSYVAGDDSDIPLPTFTATPVAHLDLAQRRAARQARLKQAT